MVMVSRTALIVLAVVKADAGAGRATGAEVIGKVGRDGCKSQGRELRENFKELSREAVDQRRRGMEGRYSLIMLKCRPYINGQVSPQGRGHVHFDG